jgi:hypothetical protein
VSNEKPAAAGFFFYAVKGGQAFGLFCPFEVFHPANLSAEHFAIEKTNALSAWLVLFG